MKRRSGSEFAPVRGGVFLLWLMSSAVAAAQDVNSMEMRSMMLEVSPEGADLPSDGPTRRKVAAFGMCLARRGGGDNILAARPESGRDRKILADMALTPGDCVRTANFSDNAPMFMRGIYAEWSLRQDFDLATGKPHGRHDKVFALPTEAQRPSLKYKEKATLSLVEYGTCIANVDMPGLSRLFASEVGSAAEDVAFAGLGPALGQCLAPGTSLHVNRLKLRGYLAEGAYRKLSEDADQRIGKSTASVTDK